MKIQVPIKILMMCVTILCGLSSCLTSKKIKDGRTAYQQKQYAVAVDFLLGEIAGKENTPEYAELSYLLGESYRNLNNSEESLRWYIESAKNDYGPEAFWEMAYALKKKERYDDAILTFRRLAKMTDREVELRKEIEKCRQALKWQQMEANEDLLVEALSLNSTESDYAPVLWKGNQLVFTSDRLGSTEETYKWTGKSYSNLYQADIQNFEVVPFSEVLNTEFNEGTATFNIAGDEMYFTRCDIEGGNGFCRILKSTLEGDEWTPGEPAFNMKRGVNYGDPVLIEKDSVMIFVCNDPTGFGAKDLYYTVLLEDGSWDTPELMPPYLNSLGQERFPRWDEASKTLYYSSDYLPGLGGLDIFKTSLREDGSWTKPTNLLEPYNSSEDDYALIFVEDDYLLSSEKQKGFFTSTRGVFGNDDIYIFIEEHPAGYIPPADTIVEEVVEVVEEEPKKFFLSIQVKEKLFAIQDNPNSYVVGSQSVADASVKVSNGLGQEILQTDGSGRVVVPLDSTLAYSILVGKDGYLNNQERFTASQSDLEGKPDRFVLEMTLYIDKVFQGIEIVIDNIYYDLDKSDIREDAKPALNKIVEILRDNPAVKIQLASHTDCQGEDQYNQGLSERRAAAAVTYIIEDGKIEAERLSSVGYGESRLEINCECTKCHEDEHQVNRRTTFKVLR